MFKNKYNHYQYETLAPLDFINWYDYWVVNQQTNND